MPPSVFFQIPILLGFNDNKMEEIVGYKVIAIKQAGLGPDGVKTKIKRVCIALKYLGHKKPKLHEKCSAARSNYK